MGKNTSFKTESLASEKAEMPTPSDQGTCNYLSYMVRMKQIIKAVELEIMMASVEGSWYFEIKRCHSPSREVRSHWWVLPETNTGRGFLDILLSTSCIGGHESWIRKKNENALRIIVLQNRIVATILVRCSQNSENIWKVDLPINMLNEKVVNE